MKVIVQAVYETSQLEGKASLEEPPTITAALAAKAANPDLTLVKISNSVTAMSKLSAKVAQAADPEQPNPATVMIGDSWCNLFKRNTKRLEKKGKSCTLPFGETCVKISNSVIEQNQKAWDSFIKGQFYSDPSSKGVLHNVVNGIWSRQFKDILVSKLEGNVFFFRILNVSIRNHVLNHRLWKIKCQMMFVANLKPGVVPVKPELTSASIWL